MTTRLFNKPKTPWKLVDLSVKNCICEKLAFVVVVEYNVEKLQSFYKTVVYN